MKVKSNQIFMSESNSEWTLFEENNFHADIMVIRSKNRIVTSK